MSIEVGGLVTGETTGKPPALGLVAGTVPATPLKYSVSLAQGSTCSSMTS